MDPLSRMEVSTTDPSDTGILSRRFHALKWRLTVEFTFRNVEKLRNVSGESESANDLVGDILVMVVHDERVDVLYCQTPIFGPDVLIRNRPRGSPSLPSL